MARSERPRSPCPTPGWPRPSGSQEGGTLGNSAKIVILAEDECQQNFAYQWAREHKFGRLEIRRVRLPNGKGSGEQSVRTQFPTELRTIRSRHSHCWLIVLTDADQEGTQRRRGQLAQAAQAAEVDPPRDEDPVAVLVPKRNIETWIRALSGGPVDEQSDYRLDSIRNPGDCGKAGAALARASERSPDWPPSLSEGFQELRRLRVKR